MRELKFRSWANGSMWKVNGLACSDNSDHMDLVDDSIGGEIYVKDFEESEYRVIMQYTGLKDKNGKEIYEGDILQHKTAAWKGVVIFQDGAYKVETPISKWTLNWLRVEKTEVIGNIYEHPHLLNKEVHQ